MASSIVPARRCGRPSAIDANPFCAPGWRPAIFAFNAQSLRSGVSPEAVGRPLQESPPRATGKPGCHRALGGLAPTASGANSVASALGIRGRDPGEAVRTYHQGSERTLKIGTFYFGGIRNFLLWSDMHPILPMFSAEIISPKGLRPWRGQG